ncbi:MAG: LysR family transcriptional regulator [Pseudorhodoplanes sp.]|nr:LysR family transcriptional regulator [Pseudorhodoplanes sp.]
MNDITQFTGNIGTELLRTFVTLVDTRSFTRTAGRLGISQPTVSGHVKRLQDHLQIELFDRSVPGVRLTQQGEIVASYARQILSVHDELFDRIERGKSETIRVRIGVPYELRCSSIVPALAACRAQDPDLHFDIHRDISGNLLRQLHQGNLDVCIAVTTFEPETKTISHWREPMYWVSSRQFPLTAESPVPVIAHAAGSVSRDIMVSALRDAGIDFRVILSAEHVSGVVAAVEEGLGYSVLKKSQIGGDLYEVPGDVGLPSLREAHWGVYLANDGKSDSMADLAKALGQVVMRSSPRRR